MYYRARFAELENDENEARTQLRLWTGRLKRLNARYRNGNFMTARTLLSINTAEENITHWQFVMAKLARRRNVLSVAALKWAAKDIVEDGTVPPIDPLSIDNDGRPIIIHIETSDEEEEQEIRFLKLDSFPTSP